jgi:hypothetical protein
MPDRKPVAVRVLADLRQAQRSRVLDQGPEHPASSREIADAAACRRVDANRDEPVELATALVQYAERGVACGGDLEGLPKNAVQDRLGVVLGHELSADLQETPKMVTL